jgi:Thioredoxin
MREDAIEFVKVDVDRLRDLSRKLKISAMPTFQLYRGDALLGEVVGADYKSILDLVRQHVSE